MKIKKLLAVIILVGIGPMLFAERSARLPDILKPFSFAVDGNQLYIAEQTTIFLYSTDNFKLLKKFGKQGDGPGEWKSITRMAVYPTYVAISSMERLVLFSRQGDFIKNVKLPYPFVYFALPVGDHFVASGRDRSSKTLSDNILLFDKDMKVIKELARQKKQMGWISGKKFRITGPQAILQFVVHGENIYLANPEKGFFIEVFDTAGNKIHEINNPYEKIKVTAEFKENFIKEHNDPHDPGRYQYSFEEYFPAFERIAVNSGKIYARTYKKINNKQELIVMDLKGKVLKKTSVPGNVKRSYIYNDRYYYIVEDEDEDLVIHEEEIK